MARPQQIKVQVHPWHEAAVAFGRDRRSFFAVTFESPQYFAWKAYFGEIEFIPTTFLTMRGGGSWTAPCEWPDDLVITLPAGYRRTPYDVRRDFDQPPVYSDARVHENLEELRRRFGPKWGLGNRPPRNEKMMADRKRGPRAHSVAEPLRLAA
jgi:hypothetical protein